MKIAIIGSNKPDTIEFNLNEAFNYNGHNCHVFDILDKKILHNKYIFTVNKILRYYNDYFDKIQFINHAKIVCQYNPDLVVCVYRFIHPDFVSYIKKNIKCIIIHVNPDALTTFQLQQIFVSDYDAWFSKDPYIVNFMKHNMKLNAILYNEAFNIRYHKKPNIDKEQAEKETKIDVMTYGSVYPYRALMLKQVIKAGIDLKIYGTRPHRFYDKYLNKAYQNKYITGEKKSQLLYGSKIVLNQMHFAEIESVNNRFFEAFGAGAFQLVDYRPILNELLPIDPEQISFKSIDEAIDKIGYYLSHPNDRYEISDKIYQHFIKNYTYDNLINHVLNNI